MSLTDILYWVDPVVWSKRFDLPLSVTCFFIYFIVFHIACAFFGIADYWKLLRKYKLHESDEKTYLQLLPRVVFNQLAFYLTSCYIGEKMGWIFRTPSKVSYSES